MKKSKQRDLIYDLIKGCCDHPTADTIYMRAREIEPKISLGTVYRNLGQMCEENKVLSIETVDKKIHYDGDMRYHEHFLCRNCGKIVDLWSEPMSFEKLEKLGLKVDSVKCVYYGLCDECQKNENLCQSTSENK